MIDVQFTSCVFPQQEIRNCHPEQTFFTVFCTFRFLLGMFAGGRLLLGTAANFSFAKISKSSRLCAPYTERHMILEE